MTETDLTLIVMVIGGGMMAFAVFLLAVWCVVKIIKIAWDE